MYQRSIYLILLGLTILISACEKEEKTYTQAEAAIILDSIYRNKTLPMVEEARINYQYKNRIDMKSPKKDTASKTDSIKKSMPAMDTIPTG